MRVQGNTAHGGRESRADVVGNSPARAGAFAAPDEALEEELATVLALGAHQSMDMMLGDPHIPQLVFELAQDGPAPPAARLAAKAFLPVCAPQLWHCPPPGEVFSLSRTELLREFRLALLGCWDPKAGMLRFSRLQGGPFHAVIHRLTPAALESLKSRIAAEYPGSRVNGASLPALFPPRRLGRVVKLFERCLPELRELELRPAFDCHEACQILRLHALAHLAKVTLVFDRPLGGKLLVQVSSRAVELRLDGPPIPLDGAQVRYELSDETVALAWPEELLASRPSAAASGDGASPLAAAMAEDHRWEPELARARARFLASRIAEDAQGWPLLDLRAVGAGEAAWVAGLSGRTLLALQEVVRQGGGKGFHALALGAAVVLTRCESAFAELTELSYVEVDLSSMEGAGDAGKKRLVRLRMIGFPPGCIVNVTGRQGVGLEILFDPATRPQVDFRPLDAAGFLYVERDSEMFGESQFDPSGAEAMGADAPLAMYQAFQAGGDSNMVADCVRAVLAGRVEGYSRLCERCGYSPAAPHRLRRALCVVAQAVLAGTHPVALLALPAHRLAALPVGVARWYADFIGSLPLEGGRREELVARVRAQALDADDLRPATPDEPLLSADAAGRILVKLNALKLQASDAARRFSLGDKERPLRQLAVASASLDRALRMALLTGEPVSAGKLHLALRACEVSLARAERAKCDADTNTNMGVEHVDLGDVRDAMVNVNGEFHARAPARAHGASWRNPLRGTGPRPRPAATHALRRDQCRRILELGRLDDLTRLVLSCIGRAPAQPHLECFACLAGVLYELDELFGTAAKTGRPLEWERVDRLMRHLPQLLGQFMAGAPPNAEPRVVTNAFLDLQYMLDGELEQIDMPAPGSLIAARGARALPAGWVTAFLSKQAEWRACLHGHPDEDFAGLIGHTDETRTRRAHVVLLRVERELGLLVEHLQLAGRRRVSALAVQARIQGLRTLLHLSLRLSLKNDASVRAAEARVALDASFEAALSEIEMIAAAPAPEEAEAPEPEDRCNVS